MSIEYAFIFVVLLITVIFNFISRTSFVTKGLYLLSSLLMVACAGLRAESVSRDYYVYREYYKLSPDVIGNGFFAKWAESLPNVDVGYVYFNSVVKIFDLPFEALSFLVALIAVGLYSLFFLKNCKFYALALILYFCHIYFYREMIQIRAGLACILSLWAFYFFAKNQIIKSGLLFLLATSIHLVAFITIIPIALMHLNWKPQTKYIILFLLISMVLGNYLESSFPLFSKLGRLAIYQNWETENKVIGIFTNPTTVKQIITLVFSWWLMKTMSEDAFSPIFKMCLMSYFVSTLWIISFNRFLILGARGASFLSIGEPLIMAEIIAAFYKNKSLRQFRFAVSAAAIGFALTMFILNLQVKEMVGQYATIFQ